MTTPNPSTAWDAVPVWGHFFKGDDVTPQSGSVRFTLTQRVTRTDGRRIYPEGASVDRMIGDPSGDPATRAAVRAAWRAADEAAAIAAGRVFDGPAWDAWWTVSMTGAVFASFPASDDPDIVQTGYQVKVEERLTSGTGRTYYIQPMLAHLRTTPPGINLGLVEVPPGSPTAPAPIFAKGLAGGVAALDRDGDVVNAAGVKVTAGGGGAATTDASQLTAGILAPARIADASITDAKLASGTSLTAAERTKLAGVATGATANATDTFLRDRANHTGTQSASTVTGLATVATSGAYADLTGRPLTGLPATVVNRTTAYTAAVGDLVLADATAAGFTVTLPANPAVGQLVTVKKQDATANVVTVVATGRTIEGDANATIVSKGAGAVFEFDGANWQIAAVTSAVGPPGPQGPTGPQGAAGPGGTNATPGMLLTGIHDTGGGATIGAVNRAFYARFLEGQSQLVSKIGLLVVTAAGNIDVGVYANTGTGRNARPGSRLASSGSVACPVAGYAEVPLSASVLVAPGDWIGLAGDTATTSIRRLAGDDTASASHLNGIRGYADNGFPLPATAPTISSHTRGYFLIGLT